MQQRFLATTGCAIAAAFGLSACGGGGGGGGSRPAPIPAPISSTPAPTPTPPPSTTPGGENFDTAEYRRSGAAVTANAISAYSAGASGAGVKVAVIDSGINPSLSEFAGRIDSASRDVAGSRGVSDQDGHGTAVTAVAAAARDGVNMHGVAFNSTILSFRADSPGSCATTGEDGGCSFNDSAIATGIDSARIAGARVINMSLGGGGPGAGVMSAINRAVNAGIIVVISAGNDGAANPDGFSLNPAQSYPGMAIIAGALGAPSATGVNTSQIASFSNRAGAGAQYYLMALGYDVQAPDHTGTQYRWSGTSFAAPAITGAVALMAQAFPNLTSRQIVEILFTSADDLGATGTDSVYGRGRLNLARAFQPVGTSSLAGTQTAVESSSLPAAAGDAGSQGSFGAIILDGYSRAFAINLARTLEKAPAQRPLSRALDGHVRVAGGEAGPVSIAMTVSERRDLPQGFLVEKMGIGPEDARQARLIAGSAVAKIDRDTAVAFGFSEGAKALVRRLTGAEAGAFLIARDVAGDPGFAASRGGSIALRRNLGPVGLTVASETGEVWSEVATSATGSPYRWTSLGLDRAFGRTWLSAGISRLEEKQTLLGGRMSEALGGGGSSSLFLDIEARRSLGNGLSAGVIARRGWTDFAGGSFQTAAYGLDVTGIGLFNHGDRLGFRLSQPLRVESGGFAMSLPTGHDYVTGRTTNSLDRFSLSPSGREVDAELGYSTGAAGGWLGGNLFVRRQPGHVAGAEADYGAAIRFTLGL